MRKQNRSEWLMVIGLSIAIAVGVAVLCLAPSKEEALEQVRFLSPAQERIVSIEIANPYETYTVPTPTDKETNYDEEKVLTLWQSLLQVPSYRTMPLNHGENYRFSPTIATVKYKLSDGTQTEILLGSPVLDGNYCYAQVAGSNEVHLLSLKNISPWLLKKEQLLNMRFFPNLSDTQFVPLNKICIVNRERNTQIQWEKINSSQADGLTKFRMVEPVAVVPGWESLYPKLLDKINALEGLQVFEAYSKDLPVSYDLFLDLSGKKIHLMAGRIGNIAWIKDSQKEGAYEADAQSLNFMGEDAAYFLNHIVYERNVNEVQQVKVAFPQKTYTFSVDGVGKMFYIVNDGNPVDASVFMEIYQMLCAIPITEILPMEEKFYGGLQMRIEITKKDETVDVIECFAYTERLSAVIVNQKSVFSTPSSYLLELQASIKKAGL